MMTWSCCTASVRCWRWRPPPNSGRPKSCSTTSVGTCCSRGMTDFCFWMSAAAWSARATLILTALWVCFPPCWILARASPRAAPLPWWLRGLPASGSPSRTPSRAPPAVSWECQPPPPRALAGRRRTRGPQARATLHGRPGALMLAVYRRIRRGGARLLRMVRRIPADLEPTALVPLPGHRPGLDLRSRCGRRTPPTSGSRHLPRLMWRRHRRWECNGVADRTCVLTRSTPRLKCFSWRLTGGQCAGWCRWRIQLSSLPRACCSQESGWIFFSRSSMCFWRAAGG
mmetsp:Transcript_56755/g.151415  ORF Transcript_56755/g.151415 Transcript_56755/m.151415 type:complete len:285 (+) Transcript_56755:647-1501(+)